MLNIGIDLLRFERIALSAADASFLQKNFTEKENDHAENQPNKAHYYGKLFACKEAVFKALAIKAEQLGGWEEIEILLQEDQAPLAQLAESLTQRLPYGNITIQLSLSYETEMVCAVAILTGRSKV